MGRDAPPDPETDQNRPFERAARIHDRIRTTPSEYPAGWVEQVRFRERYDLPPFRPPRFTDGTRVRETTEALESAFGVEIVFTSVDVDEGWRVEIGRDPAFAIDRYRDDAANTVIEMTAEEFEERVAGALSAR
jgi:hypothetical protein